MTQFLLVAAVALTVGAIVFGIAVLITGDDGGLDPAEPDGQAVPLPGDRPLVESDLARVRFDTALRGYRMAQVDAALRRAAYDIGYKDELIKVLQAEIDALREDRLPDAEVLRRAREASLAPVTGQRGEQAPADQPARSREPADERTAAAELAVAEPAAERTAAEELAVAEPAGERTAAERTEAAELAAAEPAVRDEPAAGDVAVGEEPAAAEPAAEPAAERTAAEEPAERDRAAPESAMPGTGAEADDAPVPGQR